MQHIISEIIFYSYFYKPFIYFKLYCSLRASPDGEKNAYNQGE